MHDVLYFDHSHRESVLARGLELEAACELARTEARRRRTGRMFLTGSDRNVLRDVVVIAESSPHREPV